MKYPYSGCEITIRGDPNPFQYCNTIISSTDLLVPFNRAISSYTKQDSSNEVSTFWSSKLKWDIKETNMGGYTLGQTFCLTELPLSPRTFGRSLIRKQQLEPSPPTIFDTFISGGTLNDELHDKNVETFLYKEKVQEVVKYEDILLE